MGDRGLKCQRHFFIGNVVKGAPQGPTWAEGKKAPGPVLWPGKRKRAFYVPERENMHTLLLENERRRSL